jgi:hypothetical protein
MIYGLILLRQIFSAKPNFRMMRYTFTFLDAKYEDVKKNYDTIEENMDRFEMVANSNDSK